MTTFKDKVSLQIEQQLPEFVRAESPNFIAFMKAYYEFMESAELKLTTLGTVDSILLEAQPVDASSINYVLLQDTNRYRPGELDTILLEAYDVVGDPVARTVGAFVNGETITGSTSNATALIRTADVNENSRLFISAQSSFIIGETVTGSTSNATGVISDYTANPVQNIQQLMDYDDVDNTVGSFFEQFKEAFLRTIPRELTTGVNERNLLKNIKDLYRSKGTKKGHELFFRVLLNEEPILYYPKQDMLRVSDGDWSTDQILRVTLGDDTILMENAAAGSDIFILLEDGAQVKLEDSVLGTSNLLTLVGQEITQRAVIDLSVLAGGTYYTDQINSTTGQYYNYAVINTATALVDQVVAYTLSGEAVYEIILSKDSAVGTFATGHTITATSNDDPDTTLYGKLTSIVTSYDATTSTSSQYYSTTDPLTITAENGSDASASILTLTSGTITEMIVDAGGSGYEIGDVITVDNANTNGALLAGEVTVVNGGIAPEAGDLVGAWNISLETATSGAPGSIITENAQLIIRSSNKTFSVGETITGKTSGATGTVILNDQSTVLDYAVVTGTFVINEVITGAVVSGVTTATATITTVDTDVRVEQQEAYNMVATDHIVLEPDTVFADGVIGDLIVQENGTGDGDVTNVRVSAEGWGYTALPTLSLPTTGSRTGGTVYAKGTGVGNIEDVKIIDAGVHYTSPVTVTAYTNFLCTDFTGTFETGETITGGTSGATGTYEDTDATRNIIKLSGVVGVFIGGVHKSGETITGGTSGETAIINSYTPISLKANQGTLGDTTGRFLNQDGFISDDSKKIQDSYYYQDYSYVVKTASSINIWRDRLIAAVHPAGWAVFGQVDIATAVQSIANITSVFGLGGLYRLIWNVLIGRRLGTTDQGTLSTSPDAGVSDPSTPTPALAVTGSGSFTNGQVITGGTSGATGLVFSDTTPADERLIHFTSLTGIFLVGETISSGATSATVVTVYGLLGQRDLTLTRHLEIIVPPKYMTGQRYGFAPAYRDVDNWKWVPSQVATATSTRTFNSMDVYPVYLNMITTISSAINDSVTTIPVTATDDLPTAGTIKLGTEEITYTGRSTASGAGNLTGATRGANSTAAASHLINANLTEVRNAVKLKVGWRIADWALFDDQLTTVTIAKVMQGYANTNTSWLGSPKNGRCIDAEITVGKT